MRLTIPHWIEYLRLKAEEKKTYKSLRRLVPQAMLDIHNCKRNGSYAESLAERVGYTIKDFYWGYPVARVHIMWNDNKMHEVLMSEYDDFVDNEKKELYETYILV